MSDCDCVRCRTAKYETERRNTVDSMIWAGGLFRRYPSAVVPFAVLVVLESFFRWYSVPGEGAVLLVVLASARGYVDLCAADDLVGAERGVIGRTWAVARRLPAALIARGLSVVVILLPFAPLFLGFGVISTLVSELTPLSFLAGVFVVGIGVLISLAAAFVVYVKMILVSQACFVGGAGIVGSLKESWRSVKLRRVKVVLLAGTFSVILGFLLSGVVGIQNSGDDESLLRVASSVATTAFYSGVFTHLYVERCFERGRSVHTPSGASTSVSA
jgi:hypothetical protein